jgi:hypothetical protein
VATETELSMLNKEAYAVQQLMIQAPKGSPEKKLLKKQVRPANPSLFDAVLSQPLD